MDPLDEAEAYMALREIGYTVTAIGRMVGKSRPYVSMRMKMLKLYPSLREAVRCRTLTPSHAHALLRLEPQQQLTLAEVVKAKGLSVHEKRQRVRQMLGKELKWRLVPVRLSPETY